ncbi:unnamed protein product [Leptosia nina]|uniref:Uncharacterized protein n=1 Tax=Leptosia nina TaxID=320188 RepID=A0AAV1J5N7_9NEOP
MIFDPAAAAALVLSRFTLSIQKDSETWIMEPGKSQRKYETVASFRCRREPYASGINDMPSAQRCERLSSSRPLAWPFTKIKNFSQRSRKRERRLIVLHEGFGDIYGRLRRQLATLVTLNLTNYNLWHRRTNNNSTLFIYKTIPFILYHRILNISA